MIVCKKYGILESAYGQTYKPLLHFFQTSERFGKLRLEKVGNIVVLPKVTNKKSAHSEGRLPQLVVMVGLRIVCCATQ